MAKISRTRKLSIFEISNFTQTWTLGSPLLLNIPDKYSFRVSRGNGCRFYSFEEDISRENVSFSFSLFFPFVSPAKTRTTFPSAETLKTVISEPPLAAISILSLPIIEDYVPPSINTNEGYLWRPHPRRSLC